MRSDMQQGIRLFARIDRAAGAASAGLSLPTVLLFGNPQAGTPLMQSRQTMGIDLPSEGAGLGGRGGSSLAQRSRLPGGTP